MSKIEIDLENLSTLEREIKLLESRKGSLVSEIETLTKEAASLMDKAIKEVAAMKQSAESEAQEVVNRAKATLKESEAKLSTVLSREKDSEAIAQLQKSLDDRQKFLAEESKKNEVWAVSLGDKEKKAQLLIEQYTQKLREIGETPRVEKPKEEAKKKK